MDDEDSSQLMDNEDEYERMKMMAKYWRSKSLPVVYLPNIGVIQQQLQNKTNNANQNGLDKLDSIRESFEADEYTDNDPEPPIPQRKSFSGKPKERRGESIGQESRDSKRRSDWRTLQVHYYPEGGWGWVILFCALASHALSTGIQLYLSTVVIRQFQKDLEQLPSAIVSIRTEPSQLQQLHGIHMQGPPH